MLSHAHQRACRVMYGFMGFQQLAGPLGCTPPAKTPKETVERVQAAYWNREPPQSSTHTSSGMTDGSLVLMEPLPSTSAMS